jgi:hypothetical protein
MAATTVAPIPNIKLKLTECAKYPGLRVLTWDRHFLYASHGYTLLRRDFASPAAQWLAVADFQPQWWRSVTCKFALSSRLVRDSFHAVAVLPSGHITGAVPGAIITLRPGDHEFRTSHKILRGTRPLHIASTPDGHVFWGEYFDNSERDQVHVHASDDHGQTWSVAYTFPSQTIRHVHNIVYDPYGECLWILTGDDGSECQILRASLDLRSVDVVLAGSQQSRAVALVPTRDAVYFASDTPLDRNHIYRLDDRGHVECVSDIATSSIFGCRVGNSIFFSTMVEPSSVNPDRHVRVYGSLSGTAWSDLLVWQKDRWSMKYFQYGNAFLPDGLNTTPYLAVSTMATTEDDMVTTVYQVEPAAY